MCNFAHQKTIKNMLQTTSNITQKYCQETRYNYAKNSGFWGLDCFFLCSPLLCYRFVSTTLTAQISTETLSQSHRLCFMLLHYHYVSTSLTMQIPAETLSQTHRVCFMLLCYRFVSTTLTAQIPTETLSQSHRLCFIGKERDSETGFSYFGARYYDSDILTGWLSVDPMADKFPGLSPYAYCAWNPVKLLDPDGRMVSPIFDTDGNLLGSDADGYSGKAIVMEKEKFKQGMSHEEAKNNGQFLNKYGKGISISDSDWNKVVENGGEREEPFLSNKTENRIYFKPDKTENGYFDNESYPLEKGMDIYMPIDGIKTQGMRENEVFKVVDDTRIEVSPNKNTISRIAYLCVGIQIKPTISTKSNSIIGFLGNILIGGYINVPDQNWNKLKDSFIIF